MPAVEVPAVENGKGCKEEDPPCQGDDQVDPQGQGVGAIDFHLLFVQHTFHLLRCHVFRAMKFVPATSIF